MTVIMMKMMTVGMRVIMMILEEVLVQQKEGLLLGGLAKLREDKKTEERIRRNS
jgi:hypothetical protein